MWIILAGDFQDGVQSVVGPFETEDAAVEYAEGHNLGHYPKAIFEVDKPDLPVVS
jgi:hypothetical protein